MEGKKVINKSYYLHGSFILLDYQVLVTDFQFVSTKQIGMTNSISMGLRTENSMFFSTVQKSVILWKILNLRVELVSTILSYNFIFSTVI